jgi:radical SAM protein with 4Fe4S-binding SPASM domain
VSLDSLDPAEHDEFRGMQGAWARTVQGIKNSVATGIRTGIATCFTRQTAHTVDDVVKFALDLGCKTFSHFNFIPVGRGREIINEDMTPGQRELLLRKLQRHLVEGKIGIVSTAPQFGRACIAYGAEDGIFATGHAGRGPGKKTLVLSRYIGGCGTGRCYCAIQPNGAITPCVYIPSEPVGTVRQQTLAEIWNNPLFATLSDREDRGDHCGVCDYRNYCGGCRARALSYTGDIQAGDPGCVYNYHQWEELTAVSEEVQEGAAVIPDQKSKLVQLIALGLARTAAASGQLKGISEEEVRELDGLAGRTKSQLAPRN